MTILVPIALYGLVPVVLLLFTLMPARRAVLASFLLAQLFLPMSVIQLPGLPDYSKYSAPSFAVLLGMLLFDPARLFRLRPRWFDLLALAFCIGPMATSLSNDLGWYDGVTEVVSGLLWIGIPYILGRAYFADAEGLRDLAITIFVGGLIYVPLCLIEIRFSPQLHTWIYGYHQHSFGQAVRFGGYRPTVFMAHGLTVGMWMCMASVIGAHLWRTQALRELFGVPMSWLVPVLMVTAVLCKSIGAILLMLGGIGVLYVTKKTRSKFWLAAILAIPLLHIGGRVSGQWHGDALVEFAEEYVSPERAESIAFRMNYEGVLTEKALQRPWLGWGGYSRNRVQDDHQIESITDGMWIILLGTQGFVGLVAMLALFHLPAFLLLRHTRAERWFSSGAGPIVALALVLALVMVDALLNAMTIHLYTLAIGGICEAHATGSLRRVFGEAFRPGRGR